MAMYRWFEHPHPFCIPRQYMPQVEEEHYPALLSYLASRGVGVRRRRVGWNSLRPHQILDDLRFDSKALEIVRDKVVLVSNDDFILDGNHRWMLHRAEQSALNTLVIDLPFEEAIGALFDLPTTYRIGVE